MKESGQGDGEQQEENTRTVSSKIQIGRREILRRERHRSGREDSKGVGWINSTLSGKSSALD